jgi:hypothetical protein
MITRACGIVMLKESEIYRKVWGAERMSFKDVGRRRGREGGWMKDRSSWVRCRGVRRVGGGLRVEMNWRRRVGGSLKRL